MTHQLRGFAFALAALIVVGGSSLMSGCNTVQGAGKDVQAAGHAMQSESCEHNNTSTKDCSSAH